MVHLLSTWCILFSYKEISGRMVYTTHKKIRTFFCNHEVPQLLTARIRAIPSFPAYFYILMIFAVTSFGSGLSRINSANGKECLFFPMCKYKVSFQPCFQTFYATVVHGCTTDFRSSEENQLQFHIYLPESRAH